MGLCKCPKRKVTQLFCFEHRVNVCESCLVSSHESCVVQTYLSWLTDSDYDPNCLLCAEPLSSKETVRLKCLHVFHWQCLSARASQMPETTAPAGFKCPSCLDVVFPSPNQTSPVVDQLREKLKTVNWGRTGLGMDALTQGDSVAWSSPASNIMPSTALPQPQFNAPSDSFSVNIDMNNSRTPFETSARFTSRSKNSTGGDTISLLSRATAEDESKYAKKNTERSFRIGRTPRSVKRILTVVIVLALVYMAFYVLGRSDSSLEDPMFDPHANPNIRIESNNAV
jgi:hypothetical protein